MKKIELGDKSFSEIIKSNFVYADKTQFIYELAKTNETYFLSRPRKFGKSLLLSAIGELFKGSADPLNPKGYFENLWIGDDNVNYNFKDTYPVVSLNMNMTSDTPQIFQETLKDSLTGIGDSHGVIIESDFPGRMLNRLVDKLRKKYDKTVALLIDNYDAPVSAHFRDSALAMANLEILKGFYSQLKPLETSDCLRFALLTGTTRYGLLWESGIFNHLKDITLADKYSTVCGFTQDEFESCFSDRLPTTLKKIKENGSLPKDATVSDLRQLIFNRYGGYSWDGKSRVLNPFSLLNFFVERKINNYWIDLAPSSKFLTPIISENPLAFTYDKFLNLSENSVKFSEFIGSLTSVPILFQTGYLTVDKIRIVKRQKLYNFKTPNEEVGAEYNAVFTDSVNNFFGIDILKDNNSFEQAIKTEDDLALTEIISTLFQKIPIALHAPSVKLYQSTLFAYFQSMSGVTVIAEPPAAQGIPDILLILDDKFYVIIVIKYKEDYNQSEFDDFQFTRPNPKVPEIETDFAENEDNFTEIENENDNIDAETAAIESELLAFAAMKDIRTLSYEEPYKDESNRLLKMGIGVYGAGHARVLLENEEQTELITNIRSLRWEIITIIRETKTLSGAKAKQFIEQARALKDNVNSLKNIAIELKKEDLAKLNIEIDKLRHGAHKLKEKIESSK
ncbi:MAG: AAA family ATPase [Deltaproteobacteria bacterium]|jgi:hypothetical protein|nr:AAA family ATPase [Deltaproteobacteria bacterium]